MTDTIIYSKNIIEFVTVANEYCRYIEHVGSEDLPVTLGKIQKLLPLLYLKASVIPLFESSEESGVEKFVTEVEYHALQQRVMGVLGKYDDYLELISDDFKINDTPFLMTISENLTDIYQDLKDFLFSYKIGDEIVMHESLWICMDNFRNYWGQKLVNTLRMVHFLIYNPEGITNDDEF